MSKLRSLFVFTVLLVNVQTAMAKESVYVAVASNFLTTLNQLKSAYEDKHGSQLIISSGSTGKLYAQITHGAPYDIFLSADDVRPQQLVTQGFTEQQQAFTYAFGRLAAYHPSITTTQFSIDSFKDKKVTHIAIANPKLAPYGVAAKSWLTNKGEWAAVHKKLVMGENVNQAMQFVLSGNAQIGIIGLSMTKGLATASFTELNSNDYDAIRQRGVLLTKNPDAAEFVAFLGSEIARQIIMGNGYNLP